MSNTRKWAGFDHPKHGKVAMTGPGRFWALAVLRSALLDEAWNGNFVTPIQMEPCENCGSTAEHNPGCPQIDGDEST